jgi:hypothetical protein
MEPPSDSEPMDAAETPEKHRLPLSLRLVACLTILLGIGSAVDVVVDLFRGTLSINLGVLQIPAGIGLFRLSRGWRTFALVFIWLGIIGVGLVALTFAMGGTAKIMFLPRPLMDYSRELTLASHVVWLGLLLWELRVLTTPRVKRLFGLP